MRVDLRDSFTDWKKKAPAKKDKLRALLSDRKWHSQRELQKATSHRFSAVLFVLHNEVDIERGVFPMHYERRVNSADATIVHYRLSDQGRCVICTSEKRRRPSEIIKALETEVARLRARIAELEQ